MKQRTVDVPWSLEELEGKKWPLAPVATSLVDKVQKLRRKPLREYTSDDLRLMIAQKEGLFYLMPLAMHRLKVKPLLEAFYYPGDLLCAVLEAPLTYWQHEPSLHADVSETVKAAQDSLNLLPEEERRVTEEALCEAYQAFKASLN